jgi:hypothetical protein
MNLSVRNSGAPAISPSLGPSTRAPVVGFWLEATEVLARAVPHYWAPCWFTLDPASLLVTSHFDEGIPELPREWLIHEYYQDDVNKLADVARSARGLSTLHEATRGDPSGSPRWPANMTATGTPAGCRPRCWPSPAGRCGPPSTRTSPGRSRSPACCHARAPGSCSTAPPWSPATPAASP